MLQSYDYSANYTSHAKYSGSTGLHGMRPRRSRPLISIDERCGARRRRNHLVTGPSPFLAMQLST